MTAPSNQVSKCGYGVQPSLSFDVAQTHLTSNFVISSMKLVIGLVPGIVTIVFYISYLGLVEDPVTYTT